MHTESEVNAEEVTPVQPVVSHAANGDRALQLDYATAEPRGGTHDPAQPRRSTSPPLTQMFGLAIRAAILTVIVDLMIFSGDIASLGILVPSAVAVATALAYIVYKIQLRWYGDDQESAFIKAMIIGLLTAIPVPLSPFLAVPGGIVGIVNAVKRR